MHAEGNDVTMMMMMMMMMIAMTYY